jgi:outer membrane protein insertion porin family
MSILGFFTVLFSFFVLIGGDVQAQGRGGGLKPPNSKKSKTAEPAPVAPPPASTVPLPPIEYDKNAPLIEKILVKGNKKIETDAIRSKLISKEGKPYSAIAIRQDIQELFGTGFFYDILVDRSEGAPVTLTYTVIEKPSIAEIAYEGNDEVTDDEMKEATAIKPYEFLSVTRVREAIEKVEKLYEDKGYFLARVSYRTENIAGQEGIKLIFSVVENDKVKVKRISFMGNQRLSVTKLKGAMQTKEGSFFGFIFGSGNYKQETFDRDVQLLNYLYFNEGFVKVKVDRPEVYVTPDKKSIYISIRIEEGEQYNVGTVDFAGDLLFSRDELFATTHIQEQKIFKYSVLQDDLSALRAKYGDLGYAYANIIPRTITRDQDKEVDITFEIDKGNKVYLGKINVLGNTKTRDKVVRRELRITEGELYNETRKRESLENVKRLGFFEEVNFNTKTPKGRLDLMDIDIVVKERNTGTLQAGAGYSSYYGAIINAQLSQTNLLGRGQSLSGSVDLSNKQSLFKLSFTEPYFLDTEWRTGADLYIQRRYLTEYSELRRGINLRVGHPLAPYLETYVRYKLEHTELDLDPTYGDPVLFPVQTANGTTSSFTLTFEYDRRDDRFAPSKGVFASTSIEYAGVGGNIDYTKGFASARYYHKVIWDMVWRNNLTYGFISPNGSGKPVPFNELFLLGGANTLRGFNWYSIGRKKFSQTIYDQAVQSGNPNAYFEAQRPFGGAQELYYQTEFQFPLITEAGIQGVIFYDVGEAEDNIEFGSLRQDVGFGFRWFSPIGPLRFEWGFPLHREAEYGEPPVYFEFAIGAPF